MSPELWVMPLVIGYLLGAMPLSWIVVRVATGVDLRQAGSGNVGATNALRVARWPVALLVAVLDVGKGAAAVFAVDLAGGGARATVLAAVASVVGHMYSCWLQFRGGKGVATTAGAFGLLAPLPTVVALMVFTLALMVMRIVSLASLFAVAALVVAAWAMSGSADVAVAATLTATLVAWRHRDNIARLRAGTEPRLGRKAHVGGVS